MNITQDELIVIIREELEAVLDEKKGSKRLRKKKAKKKAKKKLDRCARIAKRKYKVWPSAYASGAAVKCRKGKIWKGLKEAMDEENFQPHDMYNPETGEEKRAMTHEEHIQLASQGYTHIDPEEIRDALEDEGGAAGLDALVDQTDGEEEEIEKALAGMPDVRQHEDGDYIETDERGEVKKEGTQKKINFKVKIKKQENKSLLQAEDVSEGLKYHIKEGVGVDKNVYRPDSECFFNMFNEVRKLHKEGRYTLNENEEYYILETDLGEFGVYENERVPLDHPMLNEEPLEEKKKDPPLNKPTKNTGSGKKYKVFVRDPKTGNIRKITYGDAKGGLKGNWNSAEARKSFAARHKCAEKAKKTNRKLTPGYWACRAHKDFGKNVPGRFW